MIDEKMVAKGNMTLGDLRNVALDLVPRGTYWTTWDDDDYRVSHYVSWLFKALQQHGADLLAYTHRYEYNYKTGFFWETNWKSGFVTCLAKQHDKFRYKSINSMEDKDMLSDYRQLHQHVVVLSENDPGIYVRLVHGGNTSEWVDPLKTQVNKNTGLFLAEIDVPENTKIVQTKFILDYYKEGLSCMKSS
jgi:hypothetical protein